ncbi:MAG TPA: hypothetical protein VK525_23445 [Candidatus Saccharimonadales bacterium]|nr:hypothetical protein [Candidatus Saccharimonadales bacterium]
MPESPSPERFKAEMPEIPGVSSQLPRKSPGSHPAIRLIIGLLAVLLVLFIAIRWVVRPKNVDPPAPEATPQIEVPAPAPDPSASLPRATEAEPGIAVVSELGKPWTSKEFFFRNRLTGENIPALLVRLPGGSGSQASGYWAFALKAPYGNCQMEYVEDMAKLKEVYGFAGAKHPMVGNPCNHTLFDPTRMASLPGNILVRGAIAQGSDLRPPLGIEITVKGKNILAQRME